MSQINPQTDGISDLGKVSHDEWWYPRPENQKGKPWIMGNETQGELDDIKLIANICLIQCIVALSPVVLACLIKCLTAGSIDAKSGIAGGVRKKFTIMNHNSENFVFFFDF